jgi:hypothetical protein
VTVADDSQGWVSAGDANQYLARCDAVCADIHVQFADGSFVHHLVYADDAPSAPRVTLGDALRRIGMDENENLLYQDITGAPRLTSLGGHKFVFDRATLVANGWDVSTEPMTPPSAEVTIMDTVLTPGTTVFVKAPRDISDPGPVIQYANADTQTHRVTLCASDYQAIATAAFLDKDGIPLQMTEEIPDSGFYQVTVPDPNYVFDGTERVSVTNIASQEAERTVELVFHDEPAAPVFNAVKLDIAADPPAIYANITNPSPNFPIQWVRVFHSELDDGVLEMKPPINAYEDPDGWFAALPPGWVYANLKVVAYVRPGVWSEIQLTEQNVTQAVRHGSVAMLAGLWLEASVGLPAFRTESESLDFDVDNDATAHWTVNGLGVVPVPYVPGSPSDITHVYRHGEQGPNRWRLHFNDAHAKIAMTLGKTFAQIDPSTIKAEIESGHMNNLPGDYTYEEGDVFILETDEGFWVKFMIADIYDGFGGGTVGARRLTIEYVVYDPLP